MAQPQGPRLIVPKGTANPSFLTGGTPTEHIRHPEENVASEVFVCHRNATQPSQQTGLLPVLAVTAAVAGFIWWSRHKQGASQSRKRPQERQSRFQFPKGKAASAGNARYSCWPVLNLGSFNPVLLIMSSYTACSLEGFSWYSQHEVPRVTSWTTGSLQEQGVLKQ